MKKLSDLAYRNTTHFFKTLKGDKDIVKIVHVTSVLQPYFNEAMKILACIVVLS